MTAAEIQRSALNLPEAQRASLIEELIGSLSVVLADEDDGSAEAHRRLEEMKQDPTVRRSWHQIKAALGR